MLEHFSFCFSSSREGPGAPQTPTSPTNVGTAAQGKENALYDKMKQLREHTMCQNKQFSYMYIRRERKEENDLTEERKPTRACT